jgi:hypothetical protein
VRNALPLPLFSGKVIIDIAEIVFRISAVASVDPSFTTITGRLDLFAPAMTPAMVRALLKVGMIMTGLIYISLYI